MGVPVLTAKDVFEQLFRLKLSLRSAPEVYHYDQFVKEL